MTRSRLLPSMMVLPAPRPAMLTLPLMSRSPAAPASSPAPAIVSVNVPAGTMILSEPPCALAAMIAERSEIWPEASLPDARLAATVSSVVLTRNVESTTRSSSHSSRGFNRFARLGLLLRRRSELDIENPFDVERRRRCGFPSLEAGPHSWAGEVTLPTMRHPGDGYPRRLPIFPECPTTPSGWAGPPDTFEVRDLDAGPGPCHRPDDCRPRRSAGRGLGPRGRQQAPLRLVPCDSEPGVNQSRFDGRRQPPRVIARPAPARVSETRKPTASIEEAGGFEESSYHATRERRPSRREGTLHVVVVGRRVVAGDGRVVDGRGADDGDAAGHPDAGKPGGAGAPEGRQARGTVRTAATAGDGGSSATSQPGRQGIGLVGGDDVGGLALLGPLLRTEPGLDGESAGRRVEDAAALADAALAAIAAIAARGGAAGASERGRNGGATDSAGGGIAVTPVATDAAVGLVGGVVDGDAREGGDTAVEQAAALGRSRRHRQAHPSRRSSFHRSRRRPGRYRCHPGRRGRCCRFRRRRHRRRWPDCRQTCWPPADWTVSAP